MENVTLGQIIAWIVGLTTIVGFFVAIFKWYKAAFDDRFDKIEKRLDNVESTYEKQGEEIKDSKEERLILLNGLLACLKGLHNDLNCNGPVTQGIKEIEDYLIRKSHE